MDSKIIENISKVSTFEDKLTIVEHFLQEEKYAKSYQTVAGMIETICIAVLEKVYCEKVENSSIVCLANSLEKRQENEIKEHLIEINGEYNEIKLNEANQMDVLDLLGHLDEIVKIILEEHGNIF